jgi:hypothetical protein
MADMNPEQFIGLGKELAAGGFSRKVAGRGAGSTPQGNKYMVGGYQGVGGDFAPEPRMGDSDIHEFASQPDISPTLHEDNVYLGGWLGSDPPRQSFDASQAFDRRNPKARYEGLISAAERNQEAVARIDKGEYASDVDYPYYVEGAPQTGRAPDLFDAAWASSRGASQVDPVWKQIKGGDNDG